MLLFQKSTRFLTNEANKWEDDNNAIVAVAKEMSKQLQNMADYTHQTGPITVCIKNFIRVLYCVLWYSVI